MGCKWYSFRQTACEFKCKFLHFCIILKTISTSQNKVYKGKTNIQPATDYTIVGTKAWTLAQKGNKSVQSILAGQLGDPAGCCKNRHRHVTEMVSVSATTPHYTNRYLFLCTICDSSACAFCRHKDDSVSHLFWSYQVTQTFWADLAILFTYGQMLSPQQFDF